MKLHHELEWSEIKKIIESWAKQRYMWPEDKINTNLDIIPLSDCSFTFGVTVELEEA